MEEIRELRSLYESYKIEDNKNVLFVGTHTLTTIEHEMEKSLLDGYLFNEELIQFVTIHNSEENKKGEGEFQLLSYLYQSCQINPHTDHVIISPDADIILLHLIEMSKGFNHYNHNVFIFNINSNSPISGQDSKKASCNYLGCEDIEISIIYMNLYFQLFMQNPNIMLQTTGLDNKKMFQDICFLFSLFAGNDIIPNLLCVDIDIFI